MLLPLVLLLPAAGATPPSDASGTIVVGSPGFALIRVAGDVTIYTVTEHDTYTGTLVGLTDGESTLRLEASGNFTLEGQHVFTGTIDGDRIVVSATIDDTIAHQTVVRGPVSLRLGVEPNMGPCPICRRPVRTRGSFSQVHPA